MEEALTISTGFPRNQFVSPTVYHKPFRIIREHEEVIPVNDLSGNPIELGIIDIDERITEKEVINLVKDTTLGIFSVVLGGIIIYYASKSNT